MNKYVWSLLVILGVMSLIRFAISPYTGSSQAAELSFTPEDISTLPEANAATSAPLALNGEERQADRIPPQKDPKPQVSLPSPATLPQVQTPALHRGERPSAPARSETGSAQSSEGNGDNVSVPPTVPSVPKIPDDNGTTTATSTPPGETPQTPVPENPPPVIGAIENFVPLPKIPRKGAYVRINPYEIGGPDTPDSDFWSDSGQVAYEPDKNDGTDPGLARIQTFAYYDHVFAVSPRLDFAGTKTPNPDPSTASLPTPKPKVVDIARNYGLIQNEALVLYDDGLLSFAGTQTSRSSTKGETEYPSLRFPSTKIPKAIALTSANEFALVALEDTSTHTGQVAVIALEGKYIPYHTMPHMALPNQGSWSDFKLLGYIDLPFGDPTAITAASNGSWTSPSVTGNKSLGQIDLANEATRKLLYEGAWRNVVATRGYALVASKSSNQAAFIDLSPLLGYVRESYLSSGESFKATVAARGDNESAFPKAFTAASTIKPKVVASFPVDSPTAVLAGIRIAPFSAQKFKAYVASENGTIHIFSPQYLMARSPAVPEPEPLTEIGTVKVGSNPTDMKFVRYSENFTLPNTPPSLGGKNPSPQSPYNDMFYVVSRGDKEIDAVVVWGNQGYVYRRIKDARMTDPVAIDVADRARILTVADYEGRKIVSFRIGDLRSRDGKTVYPPGPAGVTIIPGTNDFEFTGELKLPGKPFAVSTVNVN